MLLLSFIEQLNIQNEVNNTFDTFGSGMNRFITIYKAPIQIPINVNPLGNIFGFGERQETPTYNVVAQSGVFPAIIRYMDMEKESKNNPLSSEIMARIYSGPVTIKIKRDCRDFLNNGPNERIIVDGRTFLLYSDERHQTFAGTDYFIFSLRNEK